MIANTEVNYKHPGKTATEMEDTLPQWLSRVGMGRDRVAVRGWQYS